MNSDVTQETHRPFSLPLGTPVGGIDNKAQVTFYFGCGTSVCFLSRAVSEKELQQRFYTQRDCAEHGMKLCLVGLSPG